MNGQNFPTAMTIAAQPIGGPVVPQAYASPGLSVMQVWSVVKAYKKQTIAITLFFMFAAGIVTKLLPKTYEATATLMVNSQSNDPLANKDAMNGAPASYIATQIELMQSPEVLLPVIDRLKLTENKHYVAGYRGDGSTLREWVETKLLKSLTVEQGRSGSQLIYVTYAAESANEAAEVANTVAEVYTEQQYQRLIGPASDSAKRYTEQLDELKNKVSRAQEQVTQFRQRTGLIDLQAKADSDTADLNSLQQRLLEAQNTRRALEASLSGNVATGDRVLASTAIQTLKTQLSTQEAKMAELRTSLGPKHPQVVELQAQIDSTRKALSDEMNTYSLNASSELTSARQLEAKLQKAVDAQREKVLENRRIQDEGTKYLLELESAQSVYKRALDSYDQIMFASSGRFSNISFVSRATPPLKPSKPKAIKNVIKGTMAGLFLGLVGPLGYGFLLNRRIRCRDDIERDYGIPVLVEFQEFPAGATP
jgi:uncharacterized protein involved in exopolysaccharide biosynthesis